MFSGPLEKLKSVNYEDRILAVKELGKSKDPGAVEALIGVLKGESDVNVRNYAAKALGQIGDKRAVGPLIAMLMEENLTPRTMAAMALDDIDREWRQSEAVCQALQGILDALKNPSPKVRRGAAGALAEVRNSRAIEPLLTALKDEDANVSEEAKGALREISNRSSGRCGDVRAVPLLIDLLNDRDPLLRQLAADLLRRFGDVRSIAPLVTASKDKNMEVRMASRDALECIDADWRDSEGAKAAVPTLVAALKDSAWQVRGAAAEALGKIGDVRAGQSLVAALDIERSPSVRMAAADALAKIRGLTVPVPPSPPGATRILNFFQRREFCCGGCGMLLEKIGVPPEISAVQRIAETYKNVAYFGDGDVPREVKADPYLYRGLYCSSCNQAFCPACAEMQTARCPRCLKWGLKPAYRPLLKRIAG